MDDRQLVQQVRRVLTERLPGASGETVRLWFCRLCALHYAKVNRIFLERAKLRLFADIPTECPRTLRPAMALLAQIPDAAWHHPEFVGWLYQYYSLPEREEAFAGLRSNVKIPPSHIPAATQLFTPAWIVYYLVQNALGYLCRPAEGWKYYIPPETPFAGGREVSSLCIIDPCVGVGHILAYAFDALMELYLADGWQAEQAAVRILTQNLCGLDIDDTAVQLTEFVLWMKAYRYCPCMGHVRMQLYGFADVPAGELCGSLLRTEGTQGALQLLSREYDAVITNPPYLGSSGMEKELSDYVKAYYPAGRYDLFAAFMLRCAELTARDGCFSMITMQSWMFLSRYHGLREQMRQHTLLSMVHLGMRAFSDVGTIVQTTAFIALGEMLHNYPTVYIRLTEKENKIQAFHDPALRYVCTAERFDAIPGQPLSYWVSDRMLRAMKLPKLSEYCRICQGMTTSDNKRFLRRWYEVPPGSIAFGCKDAEQARASGKTWFPYNKGGRLRRWYGNHNYVINYRNDGEELRAFHAVLNKTSCGGRLKNADMYFRPALTWSYITEHTRFGIRVQPEGFLFDVSGSCLFPEERDALYIAGFLSSTVALKLLELCNPTMNFQVENLSSLPILFDRSRQPEVEALVRTCIRLAGEDWDSTEQSWDFAMHPLLHYRSRSLREAFACCRREWMQRAETMRQCEEKLNRIFAEIYGLTEELDCRAPESTLRPFDGKEMAEGLVSYVAGCLFGRYACPGITALEDNFLPLSEFPAYVSDFLRTTYGEGQLADDLACLEEQLGDTLVHYCNVQFYASHCRRFHKRPLYWLASSGREHGVYGLCYYHRMGSSPVPELLRLTERMQGKEIAMFRERLAACQSTIDPLRSIQENHSHFRSIFAAIR